MRAGQLRHRITIEEYENEDVDRAGELQPRWKPFATLWGRIEETGANETVSLNQLAPAGTHTVTIRHTNGIDSRMRVCWKDQGTNRIFGIEGVTKSERREMMTLVCREDQR